MPAGQGLEDHAIHDGESSGRPKWHESRLEALSDDVD
jgi:hypothetical protein